MMIEGFVLVGNSLTDTISNHECKNLKLLYLVKAFVFYSS